MRIGWPAFPRLARRLARSLRQILFVREPKEFLDFRDVAFRQGEDFPGRDENLRLSGQPLVRGLQDPPEAASQCPHRRRGLTDLRDPRTDVLAGIEAPAEV